MLHITYEEEKEKKKRKRSGTVMRIRGVLRQCQVGHVHRRAWSAHGSVSGGNSLHSDRWCIFHRRKVIIYGYTLKNSEEHSGTCQVRIEVRRTDHGLGTTNQVGTSRMFQGHRRTPKKVPPHSLSQDSLILSQRC